LALLLLPGAAGAQSFYVGATIGESVGDASPPQAVGRFDLDPNWRVLAGWQFTDTFAIETSYHDFGNTSGSVSPCARPCTPDIPVDLRSSTNAWSLRLAYALGDHRWQPFAALGWSWSKTDGSTRGLGSGVRTRFHDNNTGLSAELGTRVRLSQGFHLRAGYEWFDLPQGNDGAFNLGAEYRF
jgi:opacity protein-like surface antigen